MPNAAALRTPPRRKPSEERGTSVIGTRIGGLAELIDDGVNGRLVQRG